MKLLGLMMLLAIAPTRVGTVLDGWKPPVDQCVHEPSVYHSCEGQVNSLRCADLLEACLLQREPNLVRRQGATVSLLLDTGTRLTLEDRVAEKPTVSLAPLPQLDGKPIYSAVDFDRAARWFTVHVQFWEANGYLAVDARDGTLLATRWRPSFSPDGKRLAAIGGWGTGGGNGLQIWRLEPAAPPVLEYERIVSGEQHAEAMELLSPGEWESPDVLRYQFATATRDRGWVRRTERLRRVDSTWRVEP